MDSVESPARALKRSKELVHLLHLVVFKLTKFVSNVPNLADRIDGSTQSTEPKVIASSKEDSSHVLGLKWDHNNDTLMVSRGTSSTVSTSFEDLELHMFGVSSQEVFSTVAFLRAREPTCFKRVLTATATIIVRSFKRVLCTILGTRRLTDEVLIITFCQVKHALNSRPITPVSADPSDLGALSPNHFLLGNQARSLPSIIGVDEIDHHKRYARAQSHANAIWSRWIKEYVPTLNRSSEWQTPSEQHLKTGDLVWVAEETNPWGYYPIARITELRYGLDSFARSAVLRTSSRSLVRRLVKLVPILPASSSGPEDVSN